MAFKVKDLMINDLSSGVGGARAAEKLSDVTILCGLTWVCDITRIFTGCGLTHSPILDRPDSQSVTNPESQLSSLFALKASLRQQLAAIEQQEAAAKSGLSPQSVEEIDSLTAKLHDAVDELKTRRAELLTKQ